MSYDVFISYRRVGGANYARILKPELEKRGYRVFLDYDELKDGRFDRRIMEAIDSAPIFIFILSPGSLDRCINEDDWVRQEILYALQHERNIIPVNFDGLFNGFPSGIPAAISEGLGQHQFSKLDSESLLKESIDKLVNERISPIIAPAGYSADTQVGAEILINADTSCIVMRSGRRMALVTPEKESPIRLARGKHKLDIISTDYPEIRKQILYEVPDNNYSDILEVRLLPSIIGIAALVPVKKGNRYGYGDAFGNLLIDYIFDDAKNFCEGLAAVKVGNRWGYIDKKGDYAAICEYTEARDFSGGMAIVRNTDSLYGYIDAQGRSVIPCRFQYTENFHGDSAVVRDSNGFWGKIDRRGNFKDLALSPLKKDNLFGFADKDGKIRISCQFKDAAPFVDGLARVQDNSELFGYIDKSGGTAIPCRFSVAEDFIKGFACVRTGDGIWGEIDKRGNFNPSILSPVKDGVRYGYADSHGNVRIPCVFAEADDFRENLAFVKKDGLYGYIKLNGDFAFPQRFEKAKGFYEGLAAVSDKNECFGYIDKTGEFVIAPQYIYADSFKVGQARVCCENGIWGFIDKKNVFTAARLSPVKKDGRYGYVDQNGFICFEYRCEWAGEFSEGLAVVVDENNQYGFIDATGRNVIPCRYREALNFCEGLARVKDDSGLWGFIDKSVKEVIPCQYVVCHPFKNGSAGVRNKEGYWGYIDKKGIFELAAIHPEKRGNSYGYTDRKGVVVIDFVFKSAEPFCEGLAAVQDKNGLWGFINAKGETVVKFQYENCCSFKGGVARVMNRQNHYWGCINKSGKIIVPFIGIYSIDIGDCCNGLISCRNEKSLVGYYDINGRLAIPFAYHNASDFSENLAAVSIHKRKFKIIGRVWDIASEIRTLENKIWKSGTPMKYRFFYFEWNQFYGFINKKGEMVIPCIYQEAHSFSGGKALVIDAKGNEFYIDKTGKRVE